MARKSKNVKVVTTGKKGLAILTKKHWSIIPYTDIKFSKKKKKGR